MSFEIEFIAGLDLSKAFYTEAVKPILNKHFSDLLYSAALIGSGSEVLGFDSKMSCDHHWGPRVMLFVKQEDLSKYKVKITDVLSSELPRKFKGYPTSYTDPAVNGVQLLEYSEEGPINHRVEIMSIADYFDQYLGLDIKQEIDAIDWLTFPEQKLLSITKGAVFHDQIGLETVCKKFAYYPHDIWLYILASCWERIEQEEHLMGRAGLVEDEIGSSIIATRLVRDLMHLCFLMEKQYAPYAKWFGTAFKKLKSARTLEPILNNVLEANNWQDRQKHLASAYEYVASLHNELQITGLMPNKATQFFDRPFLVISKGEFSKAIVAKISDPIVRKIMEKPHIGNIDQISDNTVILSNPAWRKTLRGLYIT